MAQWPGNHISSMQLFYALKQKYPNIPDRLVSHCMKKAHGDEKACQELLESPEFSPYQMRKANNISQVEGKTKDLNGSVVHSTPTTACSITRRAPQTTPRILAMPSTFIHYNSGIAALIHAQLQRKKNLELEMEKDKKTLEQMKRKLEELKLMQRNNKTSPRVLAANEEISRLQEDCIKLYSELDSADCKTIKPISVRTELAGGEAISLGTEAWRCELCTFHNHPLLNQCETCTMPRITLGIKAA